MSIYAQKKPDTRQFTAYRVNFDSFSEEKQPVILSAEPYKISVLVEEIHVVKQEHTAYAV